MRLRTALLAGLVGLSLVSCGGGHASSSSIAAASGSGLEPSATNAARAFLDRYTTGDGRVQRIDQGGDTVSEAQAYGMLAAAALGDRRRFDQIWSWTQTNLQRPDGLLAFHWVGGRVVDSQPASDADLDAARALLVASCRLRQPSLRADAVRIGRAILAHETAKAGSLEVLLPGPWANKGSQLAFNPSYVDPITLQALAQASGDPRFSAVAAGGRTLIDELTKPLPPNWATVSTATGQVTPVSSAGATGGPGMFTFDAPRTLIRFAVDPNPTGRSAVARAWDVFKLTSSQNIITEHQLSGAVAGNTHSPVTLVAVAGAAKAAGNTSAMEAMLTEAQRLNEQSPTYYGSAWVALGRLMLTTSHLQPCSG